MPAIPRPDRPKMPDCYGIPDTDEGLLQWSHVSERMSSARNYWIGSTRPNGLPHSMPVWGAWVNETFYFGTDRRTRKARNIKENPAIVMHRESGDDVVIFERFAEEASDETTQKMFSNACFDKYKVRPEPPGADIVIYALRPRVVFAWLEADFPKTPTRWTFEGNGS